MSLAKIGNTNTAGERHGSSKLTAELVVLIRHRLATHDRIVDLAAKFGVSPSTISDIKFNRTWRSL